MINPDSKAWLILDVCPCSKCAHPWLQCNLGRIQIELGLPPLIIL